MDDSESLPTASYMKMENGGQKVFKNPYFIFSSNKTVVNMLASSVASLQGIWKLIFAIYLFNHKR